jgi:threonine 3-dehydrogenase
MKALIFDKSKYDWETSRGFELVDIPEPVLDEGKNEADAKYVIMKVHYAGLCGTDRGIWNRQAFKDAILNSIDAEMNLSNSNRSTSPALRASSPSLGRRDNVKSYRIIGHEFFGEVVKVGSKVKNVKVGDFVSPESHVVCNECYQCLRGQKEVCTKEKILGISHDGGFAEFAKVPAHILWKTDTGKIRPEIAAMQEPFGNAVHAASKVDLKDKTIAVRGKVVKASPNILGRNWVHIQDGTGEGTEVGRIVFTSSELPKVGDIVTAKGVVNVDKDFGSGYSYKIIIENATFSK